MTGSTSIQFGGGGSLSIKVIGSLEMPAPAQNTIWLHTHKPVSGYSFVDVPDIIEEAEDGFVTVSCKVEMPDAITPTAINIMPGSVLVLHVGTVRQHIDGEWFPMEAYFCADTEWRQISRGLCYVYHYGYQDSSKFGELATSYRYVTTPRWTFLDDRIHFQSRPEEVSSGLPPYSAVESAVIDPQSISKIIVEYSLTKGIEAGNTYVKNGFRHDTADSYTDSKVTVNDNADHAIVQCYLPQSVVDSYPSHKWLISVSALEDATKKPAYTYDIHKLWAIAASIYKTRDITVDNDPVSPYVLYNCEFSNGWFVSNKNGGVCAVSFGPFDADEYTHVVIGDWICDIGDGADKTVLALSNEPLQHYPADAVQFEGSISTLYGQISSTLSIKDQTLSLKNIHGPCYLNVIFRAYLSGSSKSFVLLRDVRAENRRFDIGLEAAQ